MTNKSQLSENYAFAVCRKARDIAPVILNSRSADRLCKLICNFFKYIWERGYFVDKQTRVYPLTFVGKQGDAAPRHSDQ